MTEGRDSVSDEQCAALLRDLLAALVQGNMTQLARGHLYTALLLFLRYAKTNKQKTPLSIQIPRSESLA
jgi:hypothetical protein